MVNALEKPLRSLSGATSTTRPKAFKAFAIACMPGANTPSSLDINIFTALSHWHLKMTHENILLY